jgi:hypothetical protein
VTARRYPCASAPLTRQDFKSLLLRRCDDAFSNPPVAQGLEGLSAEDALEKVTNAKKRRLGSASASRLRLTRTDFVLLGELYIRNIVDEGKVCSFLSNRLGDAKAAEAEIEDGCVLLSTVGAVLDASARGAVDAAMETLRVFALRGDVASRMKFMAMEMADVRKHNWQQRRPKTIDPKTLEMIHKEVAEQSKAKVQLTSPRSLRCRRTSCHR